jgi:hypothetical protein
VTATASAGLVPTVRMIVFGPSTLTRFMNRVICSSPGIGMSGIGNAAIFCDMSVVKSTSADPSPTIS